MFTKLYKRNTGMLYRDNVHEDKVGYQAFESKSLSLMHSNAHCYHW